MFKRCLRDFELSVEQLAISKTAFKAGWEAREVLANKRAAEIEKAAILKERERCAKKADYYSKNSIAARNIADEIRTD
jgi:hypothetical protein